MTFGQQTGPPASGKQVQELLALLQDAGHTGFRDARGPLGFSQRQSNGKFTRDEAATFIESLQAPDPDAFTPVRAPGPARPIAPVQVPARPRVPPGSLRRTPDEQLAAELRRRGWTVADPEGRPGADA